MLASVAVGCGYDLNYILMYVVVSGASVPFISTPVSLKLVINKSILIHGK